MKFCVPCINPTLDKNKIIDGGSVWLNNIILALRSEGHEANLVNLTDNYSGDYVIIQSEWITMPNVQTFKDGGGKVICLLGHFISHVYPEIEKVKEMSDLMVTTWTGECTEGFDAKFLPHAYSEEIDILGEVYRGSIVWAGNSYPLRNEGWFDGLQVSQIKDTPPQELSSIYRGANVCLSLHGDFQKGIVSNEPSKIADKPGTMINERFWQLLGCGACIVTDWTPQMSLFFEKDELIVGEDKENYQDKVKYYESRKQEGLNKLATAREKVRRNHTYRNRVRQLLSWL